MSLSHSNHYSTFTPTLACNHFGSTNLVYATGVTEAKTPIDDNLQAGCLKAMRLDAYGTGAPPPPSASASADWKAMRHWEKKARVKGSTEKQMTTCLVQCP
jgi:hypothetical protein